MKRKVKRLLDIHIEVTDLEKDMETLLDTGGYTIQTASGCGLVLASAIVGEIGDINRFTSPGALCNMPVALRGNAPVARKFAM